MRHSHGEHLNKDYADCFFGSLVLFHHFLSLMNIFVLVCITVDVFVILVCQLECLCLLLD